MGRRNLVYDAILSAVAYFRDNPPPPHPAGKAPDLADLYDLCGAFFEAHPPGGDGAALKLLSVLMVAQEPPALSLLQAWSATSRSFRAWACFSTSQSTAPSSFTSPSATGSTSRSLRLLAAAAVAAAAGARDGLLEACHLAFVANLFKAEVLSATDPAPPTAPGGDKASEGAWWDKGRRFFGAERARRGRAQLAAALLHRVRGATQRHGAPHHACRAFSHTLLHGGRCGAADGAVGRFCPCGGTAWPMGRGHHGF